MKHKGTVLQIVLVCFMLLSTNIIFLLTQIGITNSNIAINKQSNTNRLLVVMTIAYMKDQCKNELFLSKSTQIGENSFHYTVDDMGDYFYIDSQIAKDKSTINFTFDLDRSSYIVKNFEYY